MPTRIAAPCSAARSRSFRTRAIAFAALGAAMLTGAAHAHAAYVHFDDDIVNGGTNQAHFTGNWTNGSSSGGLVRWWYDNWSGVKRGEFKPSTYARARPGTNPRCIAVRVRFQTLTASPSFSVPLGVSVTVGLTNSTNQYTVSCRGILSTTPPAPIYLNGVAASSRLLVRVHADVCHMATSTSLWACATDTNDYGGN